MNAVPKLYFNLYFHFQIKAINLCSEISLSSTKKYWQSNALRPAHSFITPFKAKQEQKIKKLQGNSWGDEGLFISQGQIS